MLRFTILLSLILLTVAAIAQTKTSFSIILRREVSIVASEEIYRHGRASLNGFGGLSITGQNLLQGGLAAAYDVDKYFVGGACRFVQGRAIDFGFYLGVRF